jgi:two-component system nitrate/nitrite response regulator NarL
MEENSPISLYLVDDHPLILEGLKSLLATEPSIQIIGSAQNGLVALNYLSKNHVQVVLSDIDMDPMNGIELCKALKKQSNPPQVLLLSMHSNPVMVKGAIAAEADGYIVKNATKEEIAMAIHRVANGGTYYSQEIIPIIYAQYQKEKHSQQQLAILTPREKEILALIVKEQTSNQIAEQLFISRKTVEVHRANLLQKTACTSTIGLVKYAFKLGIE